MGTRVLVSSDYLYIVCYVLLCARRWFIVHTQWMNQMSRIEKRPTLASYIMQSMGSKLSIRLYMEVMGGSSSSNSMAAEKIV